MLLGIDNIESEFFGVPNARCTAIKSIVCAIPSMQGPHSARATQCMDREVYGRKVTVRTLKARGRYKCVGGKLHRLCYKAKDTVQMSARAEVVNRGRVPLCLPTCHAPVTRLLSNAAMVQFAISRNYPAWCGLRDWARVTPLSANSPTRPTWENINTKLGLVITLSSLLRHLVIILHRISISHLRKCCPTSRINSLGLRKLALNARFHCHFTHCFRRSQYTPLLYAITRYQQDTTDI